MPATIAASRPRRHGRSTRSKVNLKVKLPTAGSGVVLDRELDSDPDEPLLYEEQFILRVPEGTHVHRRISEIAARQKGGDDSQQPWFKFVNSRRAIFGVGDARSAREGHPARLVDLPCIIESHKTLDNARHMYKVADISQMLIVEPGTVRIEDASQRMGGRFDVEEYVYPHGITPPLHHVRKRRFRKRANKRTIEAIEKAVERLLEDDAAAEESKFEVIDEADDRSDEDELANERAVAAAVAAAVVANGRDGAASDVGSAAPTPAPAAAQGEDEDIAGDLQAALAELEAEGSEGDADGSSSDDDDDASDDDDYDGGGLFGSDDDDEEEEALVNATVNVSAMEGIEPAHRESDDDESSGAEDNPAMAAARERVSVANATVRDRQAIVEAKTREGERLTQPLLRQRWEASLRQLKQGLEQAKGEQEAAMAELENIKGGDD